VQRNRTPDDPINNLLETAGDQERANVLAGLTPLRPDVEKDVRDKMPELGDLNLSRAWDAGAGVVADKARKGQLSDKLPLVQVLGLQVFDEQVKILLTDPDPARQQLGLRVIDPRYKYPVASVVRREFPDLTSHDLADVWSETFKDLLQAVRDGTFHPTGDLVSFLITVAKRRTIDLQRRQKVRKAISLDMAIASLVSGPRDSTVVAPNEEDEFRQLLDTAVEMLPPKQRLAMATFISHFPDSKDMGFLRQEVEKATGEDTTLEAVKRNLAVGRQKVSEYLQAMGYTIGAGGDA